MKYWFYVAFRFSHDISYLIDLRNRLQMMNFEIDDESITDVEDPLHGRFVIMKVYGDADILKAMSYKIKEIRCGKINGPVLLLSG